MKRIQLSLIAILASSNLAIAGGDISPVKYYETNDAVVAQEVYVEPVSAPIYTPEPETTYVSEPAPIYTSEPELTYVSEPAPVEMVEPEPVYVAEPETVVVEAPTPEPIVVETPAPKPVVVATPVVPAVAAVVAPAVASVSGLYAGLGIVGSRYDTNCKCTSDKSGVDTTAGVMARVGYDFNKYIGMEARGLMTNWKTEGGKVQHAGVFVKPMLPITDGLNAYGLVGYGKTKTKGKLRTTDVSGLAFGGGLEYDLSRDKKKDAKYDREFDGKGDQEKGLGVFADYERLYYKKGSPDLDTISAGVTYDF